jgi:hypothetical protein
MEAQINNLYLKLKTHFSESEGYDVYCKTYNDDYEISIEYFVYSEVFIKVLVLYIPKDNKHIEEIELKLLQDVEFFKEKASQKYQQLKSYFNEN